MDQTISIWILVHNSIWRKKNIERAEFFLKRPETEMNIRNIYRKVASSNTSRLEAHAGFFILLMKGIFDPYVL